MRPVAISIIAALALCSCGEDRSQSSGTEITSEEAVDVDQANAVQANAQISDGEAPNKSDAERRIDREMISTVAEKPGRAGSSAQTGSTTARTVDRAVSGSLRTADKVMPEASGS